jgi:hypothetical protein
VPITNVGFQTVITSTHQMRKFITSKKTLFLCSRCGVTWPCLGAFEDAAKRRAIRKDDEYKPRS